MIGLYSKTLIKMDDLGVKPTNFGNIQLTWVPQSQSTSSEFPLV